MARLLTKHDRDKNLYHRPPNIEASINEALNQSLDELRRRAELDDRSPGHLPSECLVHLIRDAGRRADDGTMNVLLPFLFARCECILLVKIPDDGFENAAEIPMKCWGSLPNSLLMTDAMTTTMNSISTSAGSTRHSKPSELTSSGERKLKPLTLSDVKKPV